MLFIKYLVLVLCVVCLYSQQASSKVLTFKKGEDFEIKDDSNYVRFDLLKNFPLQNIPKIFKALGGNPVIRADHTVRFKYQKHQYTLFLDGKTKEEDEYKLSEIQRPKGIAIESTANSIIYKRPDDINTNKFTCSKEFHIKAAIGSANVKKGKSLRYVLERKFTAKKYTKKDLRIRLTSQN